MGVVAVDIKTRRQKLMAQMVERKVRSRAQQLYEARGQESEQAKAQELQDWFQAEAEVLGNSILAPLYRRLLTGEQDSRQTPSASSTSGSGS
jgi:Protein of unknown function (DUF2934)